MATPSHQALSVSLKILLGPFDDPRYGGHILTPQTMLGQYFFSEDIKLFTSEPCEAGTYDITYSLPDHNFLDVLEKLPNHWQPDVVIWWDQKRNHSIPIGIEHSPYPTIAIIGDWNNNVLNTLAYIEAFDYILSDTQLVKILQDRGFSNCSYWPTCSFDPVRHYLKPEVERTIDVSFIGTYSLGYRPERGHYLNRIAKLGDRYRIKFAMDCYGEEYTQTLNQSKIVFNHSFAHVMNPRAYEVSVCGALLFMEQDNHEIQMFLEDRKSCVLYNEDNLEDLLHYYLQHSKERQKIARTGNEVIKQFTYENQFKRLLEQLPDIVQQIRQSPSSKVGAENWPLTVSRQLSSTHTRGASEAALKLIEPPETSLKYQSFEQLLEAGVVMIEQLSRWSASDIFDIHQQYKPEVLKILQESQKRFKLAASLNVEHPMPFYNLSIIAEKSGQFEKAIQLCKTAYEKLLTFDLKQLEPRGLIFPTPLMGPFSILTSNLFFELQRITVQHLNQGELYLQQLRKLLGWECWNRMGDLNFQSHHFKEAFFAYSQAQNCFPEMPQNLFNMACISIVTKNYSQALHLFKETFTRAPFMVNYFETIAQLSIRDFDSKELASLYKQCLPLLAAIPSYKETYSVLQGNQALLQVKIILEDASLNEHQKIEQLQTLKMNNHSLQELSSFLQSTSSPSELLSHLIQSLKVHWDDCLMEPAPELPPGFELVIQPSLADVIISKRSDLSGQFQRVYGVSDWSSGQLGPDLLPFIIPSRSKKTFDFDEFRAFNFLLITEDLTEPEMLTGIKEFAEVFSTNSEVSCIIWKPRDVEEEEIERLAQELDFDTEAIISLISYPLSFEDQASLLANVQVVWSLTELTFYLYWSLLQATPIWSTRTLDSVLMPLETQQINSNYIQSWKEGFLSYYQSYSTYKDATSRHQQRLLDFYLNEAEEHAIQFLWNCKLANFK